MDSSFAADALRAAPAAPAAPGAPGAPGAREAALHRRVWAVTRNVARGLYRHHAFDHAATMAFSFFLGMIPLFVFAGLLVGNVLQRDGVEALTDPLYRTMPSSASDLVRRELDRIAGAPPLTVAPLSLAGFLWLTTNGIHNLMDVYELLLETRPRPWFCQRVIATAWLVGGLVIAAAATWIVLLIDGAATALEGLQHLPRLLRHVSEFVADGWQRVGAFLLVSALLSVGLATFYRTAVAYPRRVRRRVWPGTVVALVLWVFVSWVFAKYVSTIADYAIYYGSLATIAVVLLWLYLTCLAFLVGAEVNANLEGRRRRTEDGPTLAVHPLVQHRGPIAAGSPASATPPRRSRGAPRIPYSQAAARHRRSRSQTRRRPRRDGR